MFAAATVLAFLIVLYVTARIYWPTVATRKVDLEELLADKMQHTVRLGRIEPYWDGLNPGVRVWGAIIYGEDGRTPSVRVAEVQGTIAILPLAWGRIEIDRLVFVRPTLTLIRKADGRVDIVGLTPSAAATGEGGFAWLLQQSRLAIEGGELRWIDARDPAEPPLLLSQVDIALRNSGDRHRLTASANFPPAVCHECSVSLDVYGNPLVGPWEGRAALRSRGLDVAALPRVVRERLPAELRGQFNVQLRSQWRAGRPQIVRGEAAVSGFQFPVGEGRRPVTLRQLAANIDWRAGDDGWRLDLSDLRMALVRSPWSAGRLRLTRSGGAASLEVQHVELDDLSAFVAAHQAEHPLLAHWAEVRPSGTLENIDLSLSAPFDAPETFRVKARLVDVGATARERLPGMRGLSGRVSVDQNGGELDLDATHFSLDLPTVFRAPLEARRASGRVRWEKTDTAWRVIGEDLRVRGDDGDGVGGMTLEVPHDRSVSPVLRLQVDFRDGDGSHAARYYPARHLPPRTLEWMESAFIGGRVVSGRLIYEGPTREFPFDRGQGRFEIRARVKDGVYGYLRGWTPLTQAEADVTIDGSSVRVTGQGRIGSLIARDIRVEVDRTEGEHGRVARVQGQVEGPVAETVRVLQAIDSPKVVAWQSYVRAIAQTEGDGMLSLDVQVPIKAGIDPSFLAVYRFADTALRWDTGAGLVAANGFVRFSQAGLRDGNIQGQLFGGPLSVVATHHADELRVQAGGRVVSTELLRGRRPLAERVSGGIDWSLMWHNSARGPQIRMEADLSAVRSRLPPPLTKTDATSLEKLTVVTEQSRSDSVVLALSAGAALSGKTAFSREEGGWRFQKGRIDIGKAGARLPQRNGLEVALSVDALDVDRWLPLLGEGAQRPAPDLLVSFVADIKRLTLANRNWGRLFLYLARRGAEWRTVVDGDALAGDGTLAFAPKSPPRARFDLAYLRLPEGEGDVRDKEPSDPRRLPSLDLRALTFEYKNRNFGALDFSAAPFEQGWRIDRMNLTRPEMKLVTRGVWRVTGESQSSDLNVEFDSDNMGTTLDAFGAVGQMANGKVRVRTNLSWPGSPLRPTLAGLDGKIEVSAEKGQFLKFDPGAARLFGLLDLRSIGRYLTLDFSPAFGKGFVFDAIHGTISVERGNAYTNDLVIKGPALGLAVNGRVGLAAEDYDLTLEASPKFGNTLTLTSWGLFGPAAAAAVLALQSLFKRQIEEGTRVTYFIKGAWDHPTVTKLAKPHDNDIAVPTMP
jgi:uncharacterized protein (TIGR02099 family)